MTHKKKIGVLGIGAVGGYFGGLLAERYRNSSEAEITFIARPASEKVISEKGLKLILSDGEKNIFPDRVTSDTAYLKPFDLLICAVKSYDLEDSLAALKNCINENTFILPLLNGVDAAGIIRGMYPQSRVLEGCVYLIGRLIEPGVVKDLGNIHKLYFGADQAYPELSDYQKLFLDAGIESYLAEDIQLAAWEKYIFIAALASTTAYFDLSIGNVLQHHKDTVMDILQEVKSISDAKNIKLPANSIEKTLEKIQALPFEGTSSLHSDMKKGGKTEYRSITGYLVQQGDQLKIETPVLDKILYKFENN